MSISGAAGDPNHFAADVPGIGRCYGPAVREGDNRAGAPVFVINLSSVFGGYGWHDSFGAGI